jgi:hypothetical protein
MGGRILPLAFLIVQHQSGGRRELTILEDRGHRMAFSFDHLVGAARKR